MNSEPVTVYLGLGSNLGDRQQNLEKALDYLKQRLQSAEVSSVYETEPIDSPGQPYFLNMVLRANTRLAPTELLLLAQGIERKLGRVPDRRNAPRPIDIDILFYGEQVIKTTELIIPHPRLMKRAFVLVPLAEIAPDLVHPTRKRSSKQLLKGLSGRQGVVKWPPGKEAECTRLL